MLKGENSKEIFLGEDKKTIKKIGELKLPKKELLHVEKYEFNETKKNIVGKPVEESDDLVIKTTKTEELEEEKKFDEQPKSFKVIFFNK